MRIALQNEETDDILIGYQENLWTGKKKLYYDGLLCEQIDKNKFLIPGDPPIEAEIQGMIMLGVTLKTEEKSIILQRYLTKWELLFSFITFILIFVKFFWGLLFGVAGMYVNVFLARRIFETSTKALICAGIFSVGLLVCILSLLL